MKLPDNFCGSTHYSLGQSPQRLYVWAKKDAKIIAAMVKFTKRIPLLVYSGMSGTSSATALALALREHKIFPAMLYVRKPEENSHGNTLEYVGPSVHNTDPEKFITIFVDDFIKKGDTYKYVMENVIENFKWSREGVYNPEMVLCSLCRKTNCCDTVLRGWQHGKYKFLSNWKEMFTPKKKACKVKKSIVKSSTDSVMTRIGKLIDSGQSSKTICLQGILNVSDLS